MRRLGFQSMAFRLIVSCGIAFLPSLISIYGCGSAPEEVLREFPLDDTLGLLSQSDVAFDREHTSDGNGSVRIESREITSFRLFEVDDIDVENARLVYRARLRTENVQGKVYLEMWCAFPGMGEFFSRALHAPLTGTTDWTTQETPFFLKEGQNPDRVLLNLVVEGAGTVWIDDVVLARGPLS